MSEVPWYAVMAAISPILLIAVVVLRGMNLTRAAWLTAAWAAAVGAAVFSLDAAELGWAVVRGSWTGAWILLIVVPALLLFEVLERSEALDDLAAGADGLAGTDARRLVLLAWVLPSFLQGIAGFGVPVAIAAPMLVRHGMSPVAAVSTCLVGYHWAVTFGSMGSSYFMAEATARLDEPTAQSFALRAALVLGVTAIVSGLLVLRRAGKGWQRDVPPTLAVGLVMAVVLVLTVRVQPALGSTAAGLAGLAAAWFVLPRRGDVRPNLGALLAAAFPYVLLTGLVVIAFGVGPVRDALARLPDMAPVLPGSRAAWGYVTPEAAVRPVFRPLLHPWIHVLVATVVGAAWYRHHGRWPAGASAEALRSWARRAGRVSGSVLGVTILAALMVDAGMLTAIAAVAAETLGAVFIAASPALGALGTTVTGSTTASNALFSTLQAQVAERLGEPVPVLLSGQTAGGNVGNALAPVNVAVGASAVGASGREGSIIRGHLPAAAVLLATVAALVVIQAVLS